MFEILFVCLANQCRSPLMERIARDSLVLLGIIAAVVYWLYLTKTGGAPVDVRYYWAADPANLYPHPEAGEHNGFNYSPLFDWLMAPGRLLPFEVFVAIWRAILLIALVYLAGPFTIFVLFTVPVASEINAGNVQILLALAIVMGFRWPASWSFVLLTKVTPGIGLLWFALRRQWRHVAIALGLGTMVGWKRIVVTVGEKIGKSHLTYGQGASAELVAMTTIGAADLLGLPVSTTQVLSSGVAGTMAANGSGLQWATVRNLLLALVLTLPASVLLSGSLFCLFRFLF